MNGKLRTVVITGASAGLGKVFAQVFLKAGWEVHGTSREVGRLREMAGLHPWQLDLANRESRQDFVDGILERLGGEPPDLFIGNAGSGVFGLYEDLSSEEEARLWEILLHGPLDLIRRFSVPMRVAGKGTICSISSLAAELPIPYCAVYNGAKAALSQTVQSLMLEYPEGPWLKDVRLGDYRTGFNDSIRRITPSEPFRTRWEKAWERVEQHVQSAPSPTTLESGILKLAERKGHETIRWGNFFQACLASRGSPLLPSRWLRYWIGRYYGIST